MSKLIQGDDWSASPSAKTRSGKCSYPASGGARCSILIRNRLHLAGRAARRELSKLWLLSGGQQEPVLATSALSVITVAFGKPLLPSPSSLELFALSTPDFTPLLFFFAKKKNKTNSFDCLKRVLAL